MILKFETTVNAPIERCFDLSRSITLHLKLEPVHQAIAGVTTGLIGDGQTVTWRGRVCGMPVTHKSLIDTYERPRYFRDIMLQGAFKSYEHQHFFESLGEKTLMRDVISVHSPLGPLGAMAEWLFIERFLTRLLRSRNDVLKRAAETEEWKQHL